MILINDHKGQGDILFPMVETHRNWAYVAEALVRQIPGLSVS